MRPERIPKTLEDIRDAASFILMVTEGKKLEDYSEDRLLRQAIERNFEIIGEAVGAPRSRRPGDSLPPERARAHHRVPQRPDPRLRPRGRRAGVGHDTDQASGPPLRGRGIAEGGIVVSGRLVVKRVRQRMSLDSFPYERAFRHNNYIGLAIFP